MQVSEFELKLNTCTHKKEDGSSALGEALSTTPATCTKHGYSTYKCSICNNTIEIENEGDLAPHTLIHHEANAPTCTETGNKEYWQCKVCTKLFGDEAAANELADLSAIVVPSTGHCFTPEGTCSVCSYTDPRVVQVAMEGVNIKNITDNEHPWEVLDPTADDLKNLGIEEGSKGLMSCSGNGASNITISLKSDKPFVLSFNCGTSERFTALTVSVDDEVYKSVGGTDVYEIKIMLSAGEHNVKLVCEKEKELTHAFIYNINAEYSYTGAVAEYNQETKTLTLKYQENGEAHDNMFTIQNGYQLYKSVIGKQKETEHIVIDESFKTYKPIKTGLIEFFYDFEALTKIEGLGNINISQVKSMDGMFADCVKLKELDIDKLNTENIESMALMFLRCKSLETMDLSGFNTASVENMSFMFYGCESLNSLIVPDVPDVDKVNLDNYGGILKDCPATIYCSPKEITKGSSSLFSSNKLIPYVSINPNAEYGTLCVPVGGTLAEGSFTGFDKLYTVDTYETERNVVKLKEATSIEPGVPYIYRRKQTDSDPMAGAITFAADVTATATAPNNDGLLKGTFERTTAPVGSYVLQTDGMFHPVAQANAIAVAPYRAYLQIPGYDSDGGYAKAFQLEFGDGETTGLDGIADNVATAAPAAYYDLMGRRVDAPQKGRIYITRGKKVLFE